MIRLSSWFLSSLLALAFLLSPSEARAATYSDQGAAYAGCLANAAAMVAQLPSRRSNPRCDLEGSLAYRAKFTHCADPGNPASCGTSLGDYHQWPANGSCSTRPAYIGGMAIVGSGGSFCDNGCTFSQGGAVNGGTASITIGGVTYANTSGGLPTGAVCGGSDAPAQGLNSEDCRQVGNLTQCVTPAGKHCAVASNGKRICWDPSEAGTKRSDNVAATKSPEGASVNVPNTPPPNGGDWQQGATGSVSTSKSSGGSTTVTNYNITTWNSTYGDQGDGTPEGEGGEGEEGGDGPSASGGADCDMSVTCSDMSSVECNQLVQTWYLRCKGVDLSGGDTCDSPPVCKGDAGTCHISTTLWRMRCDGTGGQGDSDTIGKGLEEIVSGEGDGTDEPEMAGVSEGDFPEVENLWVEKESNDLMDQLDSSGFLSDRSCPSLPSWSVGGRSFQIKLDPMCDLASQVGMLVLALAYWIGFRIITKAHS